MQIVKLVKRLPKLDKQKKRKKSKRPPTQADYERVAEQMRRKSVPDRASDSFLETFEWRKVRMLALKKYGPRCQCCGATPADGIVINVDHIKPRRFYPHLALDVDNLQILCNPCNHGKGSWDMTDWRESQAPDLDEDQSEHIRSILKG